MTKQAPIKVAIIGAGSMAREHIRAFQDVPEVTIAGIHSRTRSRAEALSTEYGIPSVCDTIEELYERTRADLVVVTVIETSMREVSRACFEFPWTALLEKPPGLNLEDAEAIQAAANRHERKVLVGLNRRFLSSTRAALADLSQYESPRFIHVQDQQNLEVAASIGHAEVVVQNWMYANSIHMIDYFRAFGRGRVTEVVPVFTWSPETAQVVAAKLEFESGDAGLYECIWKGPGPWAVSVTTKEKRWEMRPLEQASFQVAGERRLNPVELHPWDQEFKPGFRLQAEMAVAAARGEASDSPTLTEAMETMRFINSIYGQ
ncbi:MAG TPA: Gfo/Idh/MocA family oxidoreductase [Pyrinomonadaceae bacterium]